MILGRNFERDRRSIVIFNLLEYLYIRYHRSALTGYSIPEVAASAVISAGGPRTSVYLRNLHICLHSSQLALENVVHGPSPPDSRDIPREVIKASQVLYRCHGRWPSTVRWSLRVENFNSLKSETTIKCIGTVIVQAT